MKRKTPEQTLKECTYNIIREIAIWKHIQEHGCNDPFYPDGCNMNLTRNHILSYKGEIREICEENSIAIREKYVRSAKKTAFLFRKNIIFQHRRRLTIIIWQRLYSRSG